MFPWIKVSAQLLGGLGLSKIVTDVVKHHVTITTTYDAVRVWAGGIVLSSIAVEQAANHVGRMVDEVAEFLEKKKADNEDTTITPNDKEKENVRY